MNLQDWLYYAAAAWFVAYVVTKTSGPFDVFVQLREWRGGRWHGRHGAVHRQGWIDENEQLHYTAESFVDDNGLLDCIICTMPYVALILRLIGANVVFDAFAIAGLALMLHGYTGWRHSIS
jgi:hypothetical protein